MPTKVPFAGHCLGVSAMAQTNSGSGSNKPAAQTPASAPSLAQLQAAQAAAQAAVVTATAALQKATAALQHGQQVHAAQAMQQATAALQAATPGTPQHAAAQAAAAQALQLGQQAFGQQAATAVAGAGRGKYTIGNLVALMQPGKWYTTPQVHALVAGNATGRNPATGAWVGGNTIPRNLHAAHAAGKVQLVAGSPNMWALPGTPAMG